MTVDEKNDHKEDDKCWLRFTSFVSEKGGREENEHVMKGGAVGCGSQRVSRPVTPIHLNFLSNAFMDRVL